MPMAGASPLYERSSAGDRKTAADSHRIHITVKWHDPRKKTSGSSTIAVTLSKPLDAIIKVSRYQYSRALCEFTRSGPGRIHTDQSLEYGLDPVEMACAAARELQFMSATGLVPSKRHGFLGRVGGEFPGLDHQTTWTEKETGTMVFASEPYNAYHDGRRYAQWAESNESVVLVSKWAGMYKPHFSRLILISGIESAAMLETMEERLAALEVPIVKGNCELIDAGQLETVGMDAEGFASHLADD